MSAEDTARAWVDALNAEDYARACELSDFELPAVVGDSFDCTEVLKEQPFGEGLEIEGFYFARGDENATFALSSEQERDRKLNERGWTAYAPLEGYVVQRQGEEFRVHFPISIIK